MLTCPAHGRGGFLDGGHLEFRPRGRGLAESHNRRKECEEKPASDGHIRSRRDTQGKVPGIFAGWCGDIGKSAKSERSVPASKMYTFIIALGGASHMRMLLKVSIPSKPVMRRPKTAHWGSTIQRILDELKPESGVLRGRRWRAHGVHFFDMKESSQLPAVAEPGSWRFMQGSRCGRR